MLLVMDVGNTNTVLGVYSTNEAGDATEGELGSTSSQAARR